MKSLQIFLIIFAFFAFFSSYGWCTEKQGRLGLGTSNQLSQDLPSISVKLQKSPSFAFGGLFGFDTDDDSGGWAAGVKLYRNIFDEPNLTFYGSFLAALLNKKKVTTSGDSKTGFQFDLTLGSEFSLMGIESLGFSFEFGLSIQKIEDFVVKTVGHRFFSAGVHFYF